MTVLGQSEKNCGHPFISGVQLIVDKVSQITDIAISVGVWGKEYLLLSRFFISYSFRPDEFEALENSQYVGVHLEFFTFGLTCKF